VKPCIKLCKHQIDITMFISGYLVSSNKHHYKSMSSLMLLEGFISIDVRLLENFVLIGVRCLQAIACIKKTCLLTLCWCLVEQQNQHQQHC
jgi:hypothetical protein